MKWSVIIITLKEKENVYRIWARMTGDITLVRSNLIGVLSDKFSQKKENSILCTCVLADNKLGDAGIKFYGIGAWRLLSIWIPTHVHVDWIVHVPGLFIGLPIKSTDLHVSHSQFLHLRVCQD